MSTVVATPYKVVTQPTSVELTGLSKLKTDTVTALPVYDNMFTLCTKGMGEFYTGSHIPDWLDMAISSTVTLQTTPMALDLVSLHAYVNEIEVGVHRDIIEINNTVISQNGVIQTVKSELEGNIAVNANAILTRVTHTEAESIVYNLVGAQFLSENGGAADAWIETKIHTYAADNLASLSYVNTMQATVNAHSAYISTLEGVVVRQEKLFEANRADEPTAEGIGDLWKVLDEFYPDPTDPNKPENVFARWNGTVWVDLVKGSDVALGYSYAGWASKLLTGLNGEITGWAFGDGTYGDSLFRINADNFAISNSTNTFTPFEIVGDKTYLNGNILIGETPAEQLPIFIGNFDTAPTGPYNDGDTYFNTTDNITYLWADGEWKTLKGEAGEDGEDGATGPQGADGEDGSYCYFQRTSGPGFYKVNSAGTWNSTSDTVGNMTFNIRGNTYSERFRFSLDVATKTVHCAQETSSSAISATISWNDTSHVNVEANNSSTGVRCSYTCHVTVAGERGATQVSCSISGSAWSDSDAWDCLTNKGFVPQKFDRVNLYNDADEFSHEKYLTDVGSGSPGTWEDYSLFVNGNQVVTGTLDANRLKADSVLTNALSVDKTVVTGDDAVPYIVKVRTNVNETSALNIISTGDNTEAGTVPTGLRVWTYGSDYRFGSIFQSSNASGATVYIANLDSGGGTALNVYGDIKQNGSIGYVVLAAWVTFNGTGTPDIKQGSGNVLITDNGVGSYTITIAGKNASSSDVLGVLATAGDNSLAGVSDVAVGNITTNSVDIKIRNSGNSLVDKENITVCIYGRMT